MSVADAPSEDLPDDLAEEPKDCAAPPPTLEEARLLYEDNEVSLGEVARRLGMSRRSLGRRAKNFGWSRPADGLPRAPLSRSQLIGRLIARVEIEIAAVERLVAKAGLEPQAGLEGERAARTLAVLVRSLRELVALERGALEPTENEEPPRDPDAYRRELAATLERVLAGGAA